MNNVLMLLDLEKIRHERIGNSKERGISGGQRKRVNIGIELVADPWMLFLDEPTSGLDSAGAFKVVSILRKVRVCEERSDEFQRLHHFLTS